MIKDPFVKLLGNVKQSASCGSVGGRVYLSLPGKKNKKKRAQIWKKRGQEFNITVKDLKLQWKKQRGKCWWLGIPMSLEDLFVPNSPFAVSVDRVDSTGGYTPDNIVLTLRFANLGRGSYDDPGFKRRMRKLIREVY